MANLFLIFTFFGIISQLICLPLFASITFVDFVRNHCCLAALCVYSCFLSSSYSPPIFNKSLSLCRRWRSIAATRHALHWLKIAASKIAKTSTEEILVHATSDGTESLATKLAETLAESTTTESPSSTKTSKVVRLIIKEVLALWLLIHSTLFTWLLCYSSNVAAESTKGHFFIIEKILKGVSSSEEISKNVLSVLKGKVLMELGASTTSHIIESFEVWSTSRTSGRS